MRAFQRLASEAASGAMDFCRASDAESGNCAYGLWISCAGIWVRRQHLTAKRDPSTALGMTALKGEESAHSKEPAPRIPQGREQRAGCPSYLRTSRRCGGEGRSQINGCRSPRRSIGTQKTRKTGATKNCGSQPKGRVYKEKPHSEFRNAMRLDISSCVRFIWKRWL